MIGAVGVVHLEADDLAAVEVKDQVEIEPASLDLCRQECHIPTPHLGGAGGDVRGGRPRRPWRLSPASAVHLTVLAQHTIEAGLAGDVDTLVRQRRDDPRRRCLGKAWFVGHCDDPGPFSLG
jgi:hypothetical protein